MLQDADMLIDLNIDTFFMPDNEELRERLRAETGLRVESRIFAASTVPGGPPQPDVVISFLYTIAPLLTDVYLNVLSSALYDAMKTALSRRGKADSEATFYILSRDADGNVLREVRGQTRDREIIKDLIHRASEDDET